MSFGILSLERLSLNYIKNNFSRYSSSYRSSENEILKRNLLFFQREYTQLMFSELKESFKLEKEHFDFLLNEHLRELDIKPLLKHLKEAEILEKVIPIAHTLQELSCAYSEELQDDHSPAGSVLQKLFSHSFNVKKIALPISCGDKLLTRILITCTETCPKLKTLSLSISNPKHLNLISRFSNLEHLTLGNKSSSRISASDFLILIGKKLQHLYLDSFSLSVSVLVENCPNLETLELNNVLFGNLNKNSEKLLKLLHTLKLSGVKGFLDGASVMKLLCPCPNLETLMFQYNCLEVCANDFLIGRKLKHLTLDSISLSVSVLVENCPNLEELKLLNVLFENGSKDSVKSLKLLHTLYLLPKRDSLDGVSLKKLLYSCPNLKSLTFNSCIFNETDIEELLKFFLGTNLRCLKFLNSDVKFEFLHQLIINCSSLRSLKILFPPSAPIIHLSIMSRYEARQLINFFKVRDIKIHIRCFGVDRWEIMSN